MPDRPQRQIQRRDLPGMICSARAGARTAATGNRAGHPAVTAPGPPTAGAAGEHPRDRLPPQGGPAPTRSAPRSRGSSPRHTDAPSPGRGRGRGTPDNAAAAAPVSVPAAGPPTSPGCPAGRLPPGSSSPGRSSGTRPAHRAIEIRDKRMRALSPDPARDRPAPAAADVHDGRPPWTPPAPRACRTPDLAASVWNRKRTGSRAEPTDTQAVMTAGPTAVRDQQTQGAGRAPWEYSAEARARLTDGRCWPESRRTTMRSPLRPARTVPAAS
jgi:hypothetical protein